MFFQAFCSAPSCAGLTKTFRIMRITVFILFAAALHVSATGRAQKVTLHLKDVPLQQVFREISRQAGVDFFYNDDQLAGARRVTIDVTNAPLADVLEACFRGQPLAFVMQDGGVVVRKRVEVERAGGAVVAAPTGEVHGRVVDSVGNPLEGASVRVKGSKKGAQTDAKGEFVIKGVEGDVVLIISFTGYDAQTVHAGVDQAVHVSLKHSENPLDQAQIIAYGTSTKRFITGDVSSVKAEEIQEQPVTDPLLALEGRVPGLYIQQFNGVPGGYSIVRIMGQNSIANGNDPLYIVDGVPYSSASLSSQDMSGGAAGGPVPSQPNRYPGEGISPFNSLNPSDIESIDVLKDADATAIYGSRGANGVILITTKKGKVGKMKVDFNVYTGSSKVTREMQLLNTKQYLAMRREAFQNDGLQIPSILTNPKDVNYDINGVWDTTRYTDWQKVLIGNPSHFSNGELTLSGGNSNIQFLIGGGYTSQGTVYPGSYGDKKASTHLSITYSSTDLRFHLQANVSYDLENNNLPGSDITGSIKLPPDAPAPFNPDGSLNWQEVNGTNTWTNPFEYEFISAKAVTDNLISNLNMSYELLPGLKLASSLGYTHSHMDQNYLYPAVSAGSPPYNIPAESYNESAANDRQTWIVEPQITYNLNVSKGRLDALVGSTFQQTLFNSQTVEGYDFTTDELINDRVAAISTFIGAQEYTLYHYAALFGRIGYNWDKKYLVNITARRDGSSRFGPGKQFGNFGAIGTGWIFSEEPFARKTLSFLSFGKLRLSYGTTGNDQIPDYQYLSAYKPINSPAGYQNSVGLYPTQLANPDFSWEIVKKLQAGLDLGFLKDRLLFSAAYYRNRDGNQLVGYPLSAVTGFSTVQFNLPALVQNAGVELSLNAVIVKRKDFTWSSSVNLTVPQNKLLSYPGIQNSSYATTYIVGKSIFGKYAFPFAGVNSQTGVYEYYSQTYKKDTTHPVSPGDKVFTKPVTQDFYGGLQNSIGYKGIQLDLFIQFVKQLGINYASTLDYAGVGPGTDNEPTFVLTRWQKTGDNTSVGKFSTKRLEDPYGYLGGSTYAYTDASFIRLKNVAISYQLPGKWRSKAHLQSVRAYVQCQNLLTWTKYKGLDPETINPETTGFNLPPLRTVTAGVQISL